MKMRKEEAASQQARAEAEQAERRLSKEAEAAALGALGGAAVTNLRSYLSWGAREREENRTSVPVPEMRAAVD
mgnify:CR=1 FL=1